MTANRVIPAACLLLAGTAVAAEEAAPIIVTATRTAETVDETLAAVTVITREEIEKSQSKDLLDLLQSRTVGLDTARTGGLGTSASVFLRGTNSNHVLVLVDGVRASSVTDGSFNWNSLAPAQIERIEIVRGPHSTLYGSEAVGGVIQIFTRRAAGPHFTLGGGSYNTGQIGVGSGGALGAGRYHFNAHYLAIEGFSATTPDSYNYDPDDDGFRNASLTAGGALPLGESAEIALDLFHAKGRSEYDPADSFSDQINQSARLKLDWTTTDSWSQNLAVSYSTDELEAHDSWPREIITRRQGVSWQNDLQVGEYSLVTLGADYQQDKGESVGSFDRTVYNGAGFLQYQGSWERLAMVAGGRYDEHSEYGNQRTGRLSLATPIGAGRLSAGYGTAFKAPTINELFDNPDLKPEESESYELGYRRGGFKVTLFDTRVDNLISWVPIGGTWQPVNTDRARIRGLELEYATHFGELQLRTGATLQDPKDEKTDEQLLRRPEKKAFVVTSLPLAGGGHFGVETRYAGPSSDFGGVELRSYTLVNLTASYPLARNWHLGGRVENLLDEEYSHAFGYNTAGLSAYLNVNYRRE